MNRGVVEGVLLAEVLAGEAREGLAEPVRAALEAAEPEDRARWAPEVAARLRPVARADAEMPPRVEALLGRSGPAPRRRYRPPAGLVEALHRLLAMAPPVAEERARGAGRAAAAHLEDIRAAFDAEDAAASLALAAHLEPPSEDEATRLRAAWRALQALNRATAEELGRVALGEGDDPSGRGGRELAELAEAGWLA